LEYLLPKMFQEAVKTLPGGPTTKAIYGSLGAMALMPTVQTEFSTIFGNSILLPMNGH